MVNFTQNPAGHVECPVGRHGKEAEEQQEEGQLVPILLQAAAKAVDPLGEVLLS
jgi:hypothetical protein